MKRVQDEEVNREKPKAPPKILGLPKYILTLLSIILLSIITNTLIEWIGMFMEYWKEPGYLHAKNIFVTEFNWSFGEMLSHYPILSNVYEHIFVFLDAYLIEATGLRRAANGELSLSLFWIALISLCITFLLRFSNYGNDIVMRLFLSFIHTIPILFIIAISIDIFFEINFLRDYIIAFIYIVQLVIVRILTITFAFPTYVLITLYLVAEGLYAREMRKSYGEMESSFIYHHAKRWIMPLLGLPLVLLLSAPIAIHPTVFIMIATLIPGFFLMITIKNFKKYF